MVQFANESQKKVYLFISEYLEEHGFSPYYKLVSEATGLSVMQVGRVVNQLVQRDLFKRISAKQGLIMPEWQDPSIRLNKEVEIRRKKDMKIKETFPRHYVPKG